MLRSLHELFDSLRPREPSPQDQARSLQLACAVVLVEVMHGEGGPQPVERAAVCSALRRRFGLDDGQLQELVELAEQASRTASDYFQFTSRLNDALTTPEKIALVEAMWAVAYADGRPDAYEMHVISRISGLLEVTHGDYIAAKLHAKQAAGL